jgi:DNA-binding MarR family transcriptional regulator
MRLYGQALGIVDPIRLRIWSEAELTTGQLRVLFHAREVPGATLSALAAHLHVSPPTASGLVDRLVRQGYLRREDGDTDRRFVHHYLTEKGAAVVSDLEREGRALMTAILERLSQPELETLVNGLTALVESATAVSAPVGEAAK